jgi:hypothetical protein
MDIVIFCNQNDAIAMAVYQQLTDRHNAHMVTAEDLIYAPLWKQELNTKAKGTTEIVLQNGSIIRSGEVKAVWNRIRYFPMQHFINEVDRHYAQTELFALYYSFLKSINAALINPVETYDFAMEEDNMLYLKQQAIIAGLPVLDYQFTSAPKWQSSKDLIPIVLYKKPAAVFQKKAPYLIWQNQPTIFTEATTEVQKVWIAGKDIIDEKAIANKAALKRLSKNLKKPFLEVHFAKTAKGYKLSTMNTFPVYAPQPVTDALANILIQKASKTI